MTRAAAALALVCAVETGLAQPPERPQDVEVPGLRIMLHAGWQLLFHDGCRFAVPLSWRRDSDEGFAQSPDGSSVSIQMLKVANWSAHKADLRSTFVRAIVHEDSSRRLWIESDAGPRVQHYVAVVDGVNVCAAWMELTAGPHTAARDTAMRIADSIGPAPDGW